MKATRGSRRVFFWLAIAALSLLLSFFLDDPVKRWAVAHYSFAGEHWMRAISKWGDAPAHLTVGAIGLVVSLLLRNRRWSLIFFAMLIACALVGVFNPTIKTLAGRARPSVKSGIAWKGPTFDQKYQSLPSGHTFLSTAFFGALLLARPRIGAPFMIIPLVIACSRIYLNAHHLSDVIFAAILGWCCALLAWRIVGIWFRLESPNES